MKDHGWNQSDLSRVSGVRQQSISNILSGTRNPGTKFCQAIAKAFDLDAAYVMSLADILPMDFIEETEDKDLIEIYKMGKALDKESRKIACIMMRGLLLASSKSMKHPSKKRKQKRTAGNDGDE